MLELRETLTRGLKTRLFIRTLDGSIVHISKLYGTVVHSVVFGRGLVEYLLDSLQGVFELYEVVYSGFSLKTLVYELPSFKQVGEYGEVPAGFSSGYSFIDRLVAELGSYRGFWARVLCNTPRQSLDYYVVDTLARSAIGYSLYSRVRELLQESSREYTGFVLGVLVRGFLDTGLSLLTSTGDYCSQAEHAERASWTGTRLVLGDGRYLFVVEAEKRWGPVNPDIIVEYSGRRVLIECKTGPPKTWLSKALKQAVLYRRMGKAVLVTPRSLSTEEIETLSKYYNVVIKCSPENTVDCTRQLHETLQSIVNQ